MANDQGILYGARPYNIPANGVNLFYFKANTATAIYRGQFVAMNNSGQVAIVAPGNNVASCGIAWDFLDSNVAGPPSALTLLPNSIGGTNYGPFLPSSTDAYVGVIWTPNQLFVMEEVTGGTAITAVSAGLLVNWTYTATTGNQYSGFANTVIDNTSVAAGTGPLLQLMGFVNKINIDGTVNGSGASAKWVVRIANHQFNGTKLSVPQG